MQTNIQLKYNHFDDYINEGFYTKATKLYTMINFNLIENNNIKATIMEFAYFSYKHNYLAFGTIIKYLSNSKLTIFNSFLNLRNYKYISYREMLKTTNLIEDYKEHISNNGLNSSDVRNLSFVVQIPKYMFEIDIKNNTSPDVSTDDIWDIRDIDKTKISKHLSNYKLNFSHILSNEHKIIVKQYVRLRLSRVSLSTCSGDIRITTHFLNYIFTYGQIKLRDLKRCDIERYINILIKEKIYTKKFIIVIKNFLVYLQLSDNNQSPLKNVESLIFKEDIPKENSLSANKIKYISEDILEQLEKSLESISPKKHIPVVILLRASGWRISDILNLKYHNCLSEINNEFYLCGDIVKTKVMGHRIPISVEIAHIIEECIDGAKKVKGNKDMYLFPTKNGKRVGLPYTSRSVQGALNNLAKKQNITDSGGKIFRFKTHAFRHTKAVELINNGMNLLHVQKWMAHLTPTMTLHYAKLLDNTMRKSWEDATKDGLFKLDGTGSASKVDISNIEDEDIIEWEWIKHNLDAVRMPLGYCMKPNKMECATQLNPCLTCRSLCTTPEFIPSFKQEIQQTKETINKGKSQNRKFWVEKNELLLDKLTSVLTVLESGKIKHDAGKSGRSM